MRIIAKEEHTGQPDYHSNTKQKVVTLIHIKYYKIHGQILRLCEVSNHMLIHHYFKISCHCPVNLFHLQIYISLNHEFSDFHLTLFVGTPYLLSNGLEIIYFFNHCFLVSYLKLTISQTRINVIIYSCSSTKGASLLIQGANPFHYHSNPIL